MSNQSPVSAAVSTPTAGAGTTSPGRRIMRRLVAMRHERGMTQTQVAARMRVSPNSVSQLEVYSGEPTLSTLKRYADAIGVRIIFRFEDDTRDIADEVKAERTADAADRGDDE